MMDGSSSLDSLTCNALASWSLTRMTRRYADLWPGDARPSLWGNDDWYYVRLTICLQVQQLPRPILQCSKRPWRHCIQQIRVVGQWSIAVYRCYGTNDEQDRIEDTKDGSTSLVNTRNWWGDVLDNRKRQYRYIVSGRIREHLRLSRRR